MDIHICNRIYWYTFLRGRTRVYAFTYAESHAQQTISNMQLRGICNPCGKRWDYLRHSPVYRRSRPKHAVSDGLLELAEDTRPEANQLPGRRPYSSQRHIMACHNLPWHSISWSLNNSMMQYWIANYGEARINCNQSNKKNKHSKTAITQSYVSVVIVPTTEKQTGTEYVQVEVMIWEVIWYNLIWWIAWY
jgi:hypothetical protein